MTGGDNWAVSDADVSSGSRLAVVQTLKGGSNRGWVEAGMGDDGAAVPSPGTDGKVSLRVSLNPKRRLLAKGNPRIRRSPGTWCVLEDPLQGRP
jgi:hypothetical protein